MAIESSALFEWRDISISPDILDQPLTIKALLNDPESPLGGNKACKLRPHLYQAQKAGHRGLLGFGGAYSNFILSLALAGRDAGLATVGVIRGDEIPNLPREQQSQVLAAASTAGMQLHYVSRSTYDSRHAGRSCTAVPRFHDRTRRR